MAYVVFFNDTATTEIYTLALHDALPIFGAHDPGLLADRQLSEGRAPARNRLRYAGGRRAPRAKVAGRQERSRRPLCSPVTGRDRKSTRLNSSHANISYAVFCLKKTHVSW